MLIETKKIMKNTNKILAYFLITFFSNIFLSTAFWDLSYTKTQRAKIMENFYDAQYDNIFNNNNAFLWEDVNFFDTENRIMIFENIKTKNTTQIDNLSTHKDILTNRANSLEEAIALLDNDIEETQNEINLLTRTVSTLYGDINKLQNDINDKNKEILESKEVILEYIAHLYKKQNILYTPQWKEIDSLKTVLLSEGNLGDILSELHFTSILEVTGQSLVEQYRGLVKEMFLQKMDLQSKKNQAKLAREEQIIKKKSLWEKKAFRQNLLEQTKWQESLYQEYIAEKKRVDIALRIKIVQNNLKLKQQKQEILSKYNCEYIDTAALESITFVDDGKDKNCWELNKIISLESQLKPFTQDTTNVLLWPIDPVKWLSSYYRDPEYLDHVWAHHHAIDIRVAQGTDIKAPADGYVTFVKKPTDEWYAYVVLKHASGFVTVYGHVNEVLVNQYDFIKAWEVFARSGWELGTNGAGLMTTGPHLHFEVFKDRVYVDPLNHLDLTDLWETQVPKVQRYAYKFISDFENKYGDTYKGDILKSVLVFTLKWESELERQKYLLSTYATSAFASWDMWVEEAVDAKIDPSFMMCLGLAESWLGRNLKTAYNVWNVWNTDSWGTWDFDNARSWVYWIGKTLNNQFLWDYQTIDQLSRYGNKDGAIYASSPFNWQNNIIKCLQALKWEHIPDNFAFRLR